MSAASSAAVVRAGALAAVRGGDCLVTARLTLEGALLAEVQRRLDVAVVPPRRPAGPLAGTPLGPREGSGRDDGGATQVDAGSTTSRR